MKKTTTIVLLVIIIAILGFSFVSLVIPRLRNQEGDSIETTPTPTPTVTTTPDETGDAQSDTTVVAVYFSRDTTDECDEVFSVRREVSNVPQIGREALEELLQGPTEEETEQGYVTNLPEGVTLNSLVIENGTATADFSSELNQIGGSCRVLAIRTQIGQTLMQFPTVENVIISVDGDSETALQP